MSLPEIVSIGSLPPFVLDRLKSQFTVHEAPGDEAGFARLSGVRGIAMFGSKSLVDASFMARFPKLEIIANFGVGYDSIDAKAAAARGVIVTNTPDVLTEEVADLALGLILATLRELPQADRYLRAGRWLQAPYPLTRGTLRGRKAGIIGLGRIGKAVARRLEAFGVPIAYHGRNRQTDVPFAFYPDLVAMARDVDLLVSVAPGGDGTRHIVNAAVLEALGPTGVLINVGRGSVVDERALVVALRERRILSAGLDVFEDEPRVPAELMAMDHIVLLPHVGSASVHTREGMGQLQIDNLVSWFAGRGPITPVAETPWPRS